MSNAAPQTETLRTVANDVEYPSLIAAIKASFKYSGSKEEIESQACLDWDNIRNLLRDHSSVTYKSVKFKLVE